MPNPFSIFKDTKYSFEGKHNYEVVIVLLYRHWFVLFTRAIAFVLLALLPLVINIFAHSWFAAYNLTDLFRLLLIIYYLIWWYSFFYTVTMYLLDTWVITDHRVIDSEQHGFFNRTVAELNLKQIEDISTRVEGFFNTLLNFGDLEIQTAGTEPKFVFKEIPNPVGIKDLITQAHNRYMASHPHDIETHENN